MILVGLLKGRKNHERASRSMVESDAFLADYFTKEQRKIIGEAVEDHRASLSYEPRSIYGKIISEADRDLIFIGFSNARFTCHRKKESF